MCFMSKSSSPAPAAPTPAHAGPTVKAEGKPEARAEAEPATPAAKRRSGNNPLMSRTLVGGEEGGSRQRRRGTLLGQTQALDTTGGKTLLGA